MSQTYRLKLSRPTLKLKVASRIPAQIEAESPLVLEKTGALYSLSLNIDDLRETFDDIYSQTPIAPENMPFPTASTLGGVKSLASSSNKWLNSIGTDGVPTATQPAFSNLSGNIAVSQMNSGTSASSLTYWRGDGTWVELTTPLPITPQVRITLTSGTAVMTSDVAGATTVYVTPCGGNLVPIYDGSTFTPTAVSEMSQATTDTTKSPAAVGVSLIYDIYVWNDSGTMRATRGPARASDSTAPALTYVQGIALNTNAITNGPAASRGTWVGCIRSNASSTIDMKFGTAASGGGQAWFGIANAYNLTTAVFNVIDTTASWTSAGSTTVRPFNNSSTNRVSVLSCSGTAALSAELQTRVQSTASNFGHALIGYNSTTAIVSGSTYGYVGNGADVATKASYSFFPATGFGYIQALENASNTAQTFVANGIYSKLTGLWQW